MCVFELLGNRLRMRTGERTLMRECSANKKWGKGEATTTSVPRAEEDLKVQHCSSDVVS